MRASFEHVRTGDTSSIKVKTYVRGRLKVPLHYHPEHEMVLLLNGTGKVMISGSAATFSRGDLLLIGGHVPHLFTDNKEVQKNGKTDDKIKVLVIQFKENLFDNLLHLPEFYRTGKFLSKFKQGIKVSNIPELQNMITSLNHKQGIEKFNVLANILDRIVRKGKYQLIAQSSRPNEETDKASGNRLHDIQSFLTKHYTRDITIDEVARQVHLSKTSLCRFLKKETGKTFSELLNEIRIKYACNLLRDSFFTAKQVCYQVGFNNPSYFYRQFRKLKKVSPNEYKNKYA
jgi:AraC-like DNA-binding protein